MGSVPHDISFWRIARLINCYVAAHIVFLVHSGICNCLVASCYWHTTTHLYFTDCETFWADSLTWDFFMILFVQKVTFRLFFTIQTLQAELFFGTYKKVGLCAKCLMH